MTSRISRLGALLALVLAVLAVTAPVVAGTASGIAFPDTATLSLLAGAVAAGVVLGRLQKAT
jgi:hypothetical protein